MRWYKISRCRTFLNPDSLSGVDVQKDARMFFDFQKAQTYIDKHIPDTIEFILETRGVWREDTHNSSFWMVENGVV